MFQLVEPNGLKNVAVLALLKLILMEYQGSHAFVKKKFPTFSIPQFAQNKLISSHLK